MMKNDLNVVGVFFNPQEHKTNMKVLSNNNDLETVYE